MNWLCKIGLHKDRDLWRGEFNGFTQDALYRCLRCEREERVTFISPLSGPRKGPMHPAAATTTDRWWSRK